MSEQKTVQEQTGETRIDYNALDNTTGGRVIQAAFAGVFTAVPDYVQSTPARVASWAAVTAAFAGTVAAFNAFDEDPRTGLGRLAGAYVGKHPVLVEHALDQDFQLATGLLLAEQARRDHAGVVEHQQIARSQVLEQIGKALVSELASGPFEHQQAAAVIFDHGRSLNLASARRVGRADE